MKEWIWLFDVSMMYRRCIFMTDNWENNENMKFWITWAVQHPDPDSVLQTRGNLEFEF